MFLKKKFIYRNHFIFTMVFLCTIVYGVLKAYASPGGIKNSVAKNIQPVENNHNSDHTSIKTCLFKCPVCGKKFDTGKQLKTHQRGALENLSAMVMNIYRKITDGIDIQTMSDQYAETVICSMNKCDQKKFALLFTNFSEHILHNQDSPEIKEILEILSNTSDDVRKSIEKLSRNFLKIFKDMEKIFRRKYTAVYMTGSRIQKYAETQNDPKFSEQNQTEVRKRKLDESLPDSDNSKKLCLSAPRQHEYLSVPEQLENNHQMLSPGKIIKNIYLEIISGEDISTISIKYADKVFNNIKKTDQGKEFILLLNMFDKIVLNNKSEFEIEKISAVLDNTIKSTEQSTEELRSYFYQIFQDWQQKLQRTDFDLFLGIQDFFGRHCHELSLV